MRIKKQFNKRKKLYITLGIIALVILVCVVLCLTKNYPVAMVGTKFVSARQLESSFALAKTFDPMYDKRNVFDQLLKSKQKEQLVRKLRIDTDNALGNELKFYKTGREQEYTKLLNDYFFGSEELFEKFVLMPQTSEALLKIKYNSDYAANNDAYSKAQSVLDLLNSGQSFEDLAKAYSTDLVTGQLGGDLGFMEEGQLLPELEKVVMDSPLGEVKKQIIVTRYGYHIVYPVEIAQKEGHTVWHVKHILIQTAGFDSWLEQQLKSIGVRKFVKV